MSVKKHITELKRSKAICLFTCYNSLKNAESDSEHKDSKEVMLTTKRIGQDLEVAKVAFWNLL